MLKHLLRDLRIDARKSHIDLTIEQESRPGREGRMEWNRAFVDGMIEGDMKEWVPGSPPPEGAFVFFCGSEKDSGCLMHVAVSAGAGGQLGSDSTKRESLLWSHSGVSGDQPSETTIEAEIDRLNREPNYEDKKPLKGVYYGLPAR